MTTGVVAGRIMVIEHSDGALFWFFCEVSFSAYRLRLFVQSPPCSPGFIDVRTRRTRGDEFNDLYLACPCLRLCSVPTYLGTLGTCQDCAIIRDLK
jgi:hypothetical protein